MKRKFETEQKFCENVTKLILGILVGEKRNVICVPEVPRYYYSNSLRPDYQRITLLTGKIEHTAWSTVFWYYKHKI